MGREYLLTLLATHSGHSPPPHLTGVSLPTGPQAAAVAAGSPPGLMNPTSCPRMPGHSQPPRPGSALRQPPVRYLQDKANAGERDWA